MKNDRRRRNVAAARFFTESMGADIVARRETASAIERLRGILNKRTYAGSNSDPNEFIGLVQSYELSIAGLNALIDTIADIGLRRGNLDADELKSALVPAGSTAWLNQAKEVRGDPKAAGDIGVECRSILYLLYLGYRLSPPIEYCQ